VEKGGFLKASVLQLRLIADLSAPTAIGEFLTNAVSVSQHTKNWIAVSFEIL
jgi:hypothetical protein